MEPRSYIVYTIYLSSAFNTVTLNDKNLCYIEHALHANTHIDVHIYIAHFFFFCIYLFGLCVFCEFFPLFHQIELIYLLAYCCCNSTQYTLHFSLPHFFASNLFIRYVCLFTAYITNSCIIITRCVLFVAIPHSLSFVSHFIIGSLSRSRETTKNYKNKVCIVVAPIPDVQIYVWMWVDINRFSLGLRRYTRNEWEWATSEIEIGQSLSFSAFVQFEKPIQWKCENQRQNYRIRIWLTTE